MTTETKKTVRELVDQIREKKDELRVQLHLAGMDLQKEWDRLEGQLDGIAKLDALADEARLRAHLAKMEAADDLEAMSRSLMAIADGIDRQSDRISSEAKEAIDGLLAHVRDFRKRAKKAS